MSDGAAPAQAAWMNDILGPRVRRDRARAAAAAAAQPWRAAPSPSIPPTTPEPGELEEEDVDAGFGPRSADARQEGGGAPQQECRIQDLVLDVTCDTPLGMIFGKAGAAFPRLTGLRPRGHLNVYHPELQAALQRARCAGETLCVKQLGGSPVHMSEAPLTQEAVAALLAPRPLRLVVGMTAPRLAPQLNHVAFALVAVSHGDQYVLVHEKDERGWWLPGGGVDARDTLHATAVKETEEEAGVRVALGRVLRVEHTLGKQAYRRGQARVRVFYSAAPLQPHAALKSVADEESKEARWVGLATVHALGCNSRGRHAHAQDPFAQLDGTGVAQPDTQPWLRGPEPLDYFGMLAAGCSGAPLQALLCTRDGPGPKPVGRDTARGYYPTSCSVALLLRSGRYVYVLLGSGEGGRAGAVLPKRSVRVDETMHEAAERLGGMCGATPTAVVQLRHHLCLTGIPQDHTAHIGATFAAWLPDGCAAVTAGQAAREGPALGASPAKCDACAAAPPAPPPPSVVVPRVVDVDDACAGTWVEEDVLRAVGKEWEALLALPPTPLSWLTAEEGCPPGRAESDGPHVPATAWPQDTAVLAYGDSLTAGYHHDGEHFAPYSHTMGQVLRCAVHAMGASGVTAAKLAEDIDREGPLRDVCGRAYHGLGQALGRRRYAACVIMAGTNDLAHPHTKPAHILANIQALHARCHAQGVRTVACAVPPSYASSPAAAADQAGSSYGVRWGWLNKSLQEWASSDEQPQVHWVGWPPQLAFSRHSGLWEPDGLHMSAVGYQRFGVALGVATAEYVHEAAAAGGEAHTGLKSACSTEK